MSEYITHTAIYEDSRNLALFADSTPAEIKTSLRENLRAGQLGSITSRGDTHTINLLLASKEAWPRDEAKQMLAFFFGWRSHIAADRQFKTLFRLLEPEIYLTEEIDGPTSISIYHDLFLLQELYSDRKLDPFSGDVLVADSTNRDLRNLFIGLWQNSLLSLHDFARRDRDPETWFEQLVTQHQKFYVDTERYIQAYNDIDERKMQQVVETNRFYNRSDPLIQLTQSLRRGEPDRSIDLEAAIEAARTQSHYARALRRNWLYLQAAAAFWQGEIDNVELQKRFEVDIPHTASEVFGALENIERRRRLLQEWHETGS